MEMRLYNRYSCSNIEVICDSAGPAADSCRPSEFEKVKAVNINRKFAKYISVAALFLTPQTNALRLSGSSGCNSLR